MKSSEGNDVIPVAIAIKIRHWAISADNELNSEKLWSYTLTVVTKSYRVEWIRKMCILTVTLKF